jgi:hypothetical protein
VSDVVPAFGRREEGERARDEFKDVLEAAWSESTQKGFELRECEFNRIEIGTVGRQEAELRPGAFDRRADLRLFVHGEVVQDDHVTSPKRGHEDLLDVGEKAGIVDRTIEHRRRGEPVQPQGGNEGLCFPVTTRCVVVETDSAGTSAVAAQ